MTLAEAIDAQKARLISQAEALQVKKQEIFGHTDIGQPISEEERLLNAEIAKIYSVINKLVLKKREIQRTFKK